jgi:hypothetical protein
MEDSSLLLKLATPIISQHTSPDCNEKPCRIKTIFMVNGRVTKGNSCDCQIKMFLD